MKHLSLFIIAVLAFAGCQKSDTEHSADNQGRIAITANTSGEISTRAEGITVPTPALADFKLTITGTDFQKSWSSLSDYKSENERYTSGFYTVAIEYGDATAEGYSKPYFTASKQVEVLDRNRTTHVDLTATLGNAVVEVVTTDNFKNYFPTHNFTLTTASNTFELKEDATDYLYIAAQKGVKIDCSCIRQANIASGKVEQLATQSIDVEPKSRYIITYDLQKAGSVEITISLNDTILETITIDTELNPNA